MAEDAEAREKGLIDDKGLPTNVVTLCLLGDMGGMVRFLPISAAFASGSRGVKGRLR